MPSILLDRISVDMPVYDASHRSLRRAVMAMTVGGAISRRGRHSMVRALEDISMTIADGDRIGLIGRNGAGKSTLLRVLAGICEPTAGRAIIDGDISNLLAMKSLLDPDMTGYENIEHAALLLGMGGSRLPSLVRDIEDFTELGPFLDMPVRTYSAGMQLRLSYGLLTAPQPDILLLDEVLGVGDAGFVAKAAARALALRDKTRILIMTSHSQAHIMEMCDTVAWLDHGRLRAFGPAADVLAAYERFLAKT
jgi:ABC-type polysaccharide/polyol phosphate transport system ATPase subunit